MLKKSKNKVQTKTVLKFRTTKATQLRKQTVRDGSPKIEKVDKIEKDKKYLARPQTTYTSKSGASSSIKKCASTGRLSKSSTKCKNNRDQRKSKHLARVLESSQRLYKGETTIDGKQTQLQVDSKAKSNKQLKGNSNLSKTFIVRKEYNYDANDLKPTEK